MSPLSTAIVARLRAAGCVFAEDEARLLSSAAQTPDQLEAMVGQRVAGLPLEYVLGWAEFCGLRIAVDPGVFVPRRRTEFLVREAAAFLVREAATLANANSAGANSAGANSVVVDLCCGSGAVGAALAAIMGPIELYAVDIDPAAVRCARRNVAAADGRVYEGDLYEPLPTTLRGRVDVLAANVPYVPTEAISMMPPEARDHEPLVALDGGADGLDVLRRVVAGAPDWLAPGGHLLIETSQQQAPVAVDAITHHGMAARVASSAELGATIVVATSPGPAVPPPTPVRPPAR